MKVKIRAFYKNHAKIEVALTKATIVFLIIDNNSGTHGM